jgi:hypothetical protein
MDGESKGLDGAAVSDTGKIPLTSILQSGPISVVECGLPLQSARGRA